MQTVASLKDGDWVEEVYLVAAKQVSTAKNGVTFLALKLADKTGEIDGRLWDNADEAAGRFAREDFVRVKGMAATYQGSLQIKMKAIEKVDDSLVDIGNFLETTSRDPDEMVQELRRVASSLKDAHLKQLMSAFLDDAGFLAAFRKAPAAKTLHHNYIGGLLEHVTELIAIGRDAARHFPVVDADLLTVGAFLHDIGKVRELAVRKSIEYTTEGRLLGHISLGYELVTEKIKTIPGFPAELAMLLKHILLSHHGEYEFGSPKRPKIPEAILINYLDDLAAKLNNFQATLQKERIEPGAWSAYSKMHDRYLYRRRETPASPDPAGDLPADAQKKKGERHSEAGPASGRLPLDL